MQNYQIPQTYNSFHSLKLYVNKRRVKSLNFLHLNCTSQLQVRSLYEKSTTGECHAKRLEPGWGLLTYSWVELGRGNGVGLYGKTNALLSWKSQSSPSSQKSYVNLVKRLFCYQQNACCLRLNSIIFLAFLLSDHHIPFRTFLVPVHTYDVANTALQRLVHRFQ